MSLRSGKDACVVILRENREGERGHPVPTEVGKVLVTGRFQESTTSDIQAYAAAGETQVLTMKRFICRRFPGDDLSQIVDKDGVLWSVVGEPKRHRGSRRTARDVVLVKQAGVRRGIREVE